MSEIHVKSIVYNLLVITCPRFIVKLTSLYFMSLERGGLCHHRSVPSIANRAGCSLLDAMEPSWPGCTQTSQFCPSTICTPSVLTLWFIYSLVAPVSLQNNSGDETPTPHVAVASMSCSCAKLKYGGVKGWFSGCVKTKIVQFNTKSKINTGIDSRTTAIFTILSLTSHRKA